MTWVPLLFSTKSWSNVRGNKKSFTKNFSSFDFKGYRNVSFGRNEWNGSLLNLSEIFIMYLCKLLNKPWVNLKLVMAETIEEIL